MRFDQRPAAVRMDTGPLPSFTIIYWLGETTLLFSHIRLPHHPIVHMHRHTDPVRISRLVFFPRLPVISRNVFSFLYMYITSIHGQTQYVL